MRKYMLLFCTMMVLFQSSALAEGWEVTLGRVWENGAELTCVVYDTGEESGDLRRERMLEARITASDGRIDQTYRYAASVSPDIDMAAGFARLVDMNFDGYADLCLTVGAGAQNVFSVFALWNQETRCFDSLMTGNVWDFENRRYDDETTVLEMCNFELLPDSRAIYTQESDGFYYRVQRVYEWETDNFLREKSVAAVYDAGEGMIGEVLDLFGSQALRCWEQVFPESRYYGENDASGERLQAIRRMTLDSAQPALVRVKDNAFLYLQNSADSPVVMELPAGTEVRVLWEDDTWARVWNFEAANEKNELNGGERGTGYIRRDELTSSAL